MGAISNTSEESGAGRAIDWADMRFVVVIGTLSALALVLQWTVPALQITMYTRNVIAIVLTAVYIVSRARRQPEKLDEWGITTPITVPLVLAGVGLFAVAVGMLALTSFAVGGRPSFEGKLIAGMIEYLISGFPQQFVLCSIGLVTLAKFPALRGAWRLPLVVGLGFALAHFWGSHRVAGTIVPIQMLLTFPMGFCAAFYFLKFRNILPLSIIHAMLFPLLVLWVEKYL